MVSFYSLTYKDLTEWCENQGFSPNTASLLYNWHYKKARSAVCDHQDLSKRARERVYSEFDFSRPQISQIQQSEDRTTKILFQLSDRRQVESVLIPFHGKYTLCISSQVGCAMNCAFCYTGTQGFTRHLTTSEIIGQYLGAKDWLALNRPTENRILNVVFMGQGEPLNNLEPVAKACRILIDQHGLSLAAHKITVSTSGFLPGLKKWRELMPPVNLALSLHSALTEKRDELIPLNRKYPLAEVLEEIDQIPLAEKRFVTYEYLLIRNFNSTKADAKALGELLKDKKAYINIIPFNPFPGSKYERPSDDEIAQFREYLRPYPIPVTLRSTKGDDILAACGQLKTN